MKTILRLTPFIVLLAVACNESDTPLTPIDPVPPAPPIFDEVRNTLAPYLDLQVALEHGYEAVSECMADPLLGGMGIHYGRDDLVFSAEIDAFRPEILVYEPLADGTVQLVAVEYFVPRRVWGDDDNPPVVFDQTMIRNDEFDAYTLHVWLWKENPAGMFADWNPNVTCDFAGTPLGTSAHARRAH